MAGEILRVTAASDDESTGAEIGRIEFGEAGMLTLLSAEADHRAELERAVEETNARQTLRLNAAPPPGAERFSIYALDVDRTAPNLLDYMVQFLEEYHGLSVEIVES